MLAVPSTKAAFVFILPTRGCRTLAYLHILFPKSTSTKVLVRNTELTGEMKRIFYHMWYSNNPHFTIWLFDIFSTKFLLSGGTSRIFVCVCLYFCPKVKQPSWIYLYPHPPQALYTHFFLILNNLALPQLLFINVHSQLHPRTQQNKVSLCF